MCAIQGPRNILLPLLPDNHASLLFRGHDYLGAHIAEIRAKAASLAKWGLRLINTIVYASITCVFQWESGD